MAPPHFSLLCVGFMRAVIVHAPGRDKLPELRQALLGAGVDCLPEDCVPWDNLEVRLAQNDKVDLLVLQTGVGAPNDWEVKLGDARRFTHAPALAVGPAGTEEEQRARQAGVSVYVNEANLPHDLDQALERFTAASANGNQRGRVWSVYAPAPGSGGTTVAANLAGALARLHPREVALLELARQFGDLALLLGVTPEYSVEELCRRWQRLDMMSLRHSAVGHESGVNLLVHSVDPLREDAVNWESVRRLSVLARVTFPYTVIALASRLGREKLEAMRVSDSVVLVVRPDVPSVKRAEWELNAATDAGIPREKFHLTLNPWGQKGQLKESEIERALNLKVRSRIPADPGRINNILNQGLLLQQFSRASTIAGRFRRLAESLLEGSHSTTR
jgi:pilus assembly protein CpaE